MLSAENLVVSFKSYILQSERITVWVWQSFKNKLGRIFKNEKEKLVPAGAFFPGKHKGRNIRIRKTPNAYIVFMEAERKILWFLEMSNETQAVQLNIDE